VPALFALFAQCRAPPRSRAATLLTLCPFLAVCAGLIVDANINQQDVTPKEFGSLAAKACSSKLDDLGAAFPSVKEDIRPFFCLDLAYAHILLTKGFKIPEEASIRLVKRVQYNGDLIEAAWPLGAAINALG
jgi:apyrase